MNQGKKILIIEDEQILGDILFNKFYAEGYNAFWETNGDDGLRKMREVKPDLVLLDLVMPKKDGYEVLEEISKDEALKQIPVIIISNSGQPIELKRIIELGAKDYIVKAQFSPDDVLEKVRKYLGDETESSLKNKNKTSGVKLWIVEDDSFLSSLAAGRLEKEGYKISVAVDGAQVLKMLETDIPDLMLLDIIMPGTSGFEVLKIIKADARFKDMAVIIFSNLGQEHEIEEGIRLGADDFLVKAKFTLKEVVDKINAVLKKKGKI
ncbi:MAG: response regulator [Patescibacteria group bacterium]